MNINQPQTVGSDGIPWSPAFIFSSSGKDSGWGVSEEMPGENPGSDPVGLAMKVLDERAGDGSVQSSLVRAEYYSSKMDVIVLSITKRV